MNKYKFELLVLGQHGSVMHHWIDTDIDILANYKSALVLGSGIIAWEKGAIDSTKLVGIFDRTLPLPAPTPTLIQEKESKQ